VVAVVTGVDHTTAVGDRGVRDARDSGNSRCQPEERPDLAPNLHVMLLVGVENTPSQPLAREPDRSSLRPAAPPPDTCFCRPSQVLGRGSNAATGGRSRPPAPVPFPHGSLGERPLIARLRGTVAARTAAGIVLDVGGVGYLVAATPRVSARLGEQTTVETHLH